MISFIWHLWLNIWFAENSEKWLTHNILFCDSELSECKLQCYFVNFRTNTLGERYEPIYPLSYDLNSADVRLNVVVFLLTVFNELSHVTNQFWSRNNVNRWICLSQSWPDIVVRSPRRVHGTSLLYIPEESKWFPPFCWMDFSVCSLNACDSCLGNCSYLYYVQLNVSF